MIFTHNTCSREKGHGSSPLITFRRIQYNRKCTGSGLEPGSQCSWAGPLSCGSGSGIFKLNLPRATKKISSVSSIVSLRALKAKIGKFCSVSSQKHRVYSSATSFLSSFFRTNHAIPVRNQEDVLLHLSYSFPLFFKRVKNDGNRQNVADLTKSSTATLIPLVTLMNC